MTMYGGKNDVMKAKNGSVGTGLAQDSRRSTTMPQKCLLFGLGGLCGLVGGAGLGYSFAKKQALKRAKEALKTVRTRQEPNPKNKDYESLMEKAYMSGFNKAEDLAQEWIDENVMMVSGDTPEEVAENVRERMDVRETLQENKGIVDTMINKSEEKEAENHVQEVEKIAASDESCLAQDRKEKAETKGLTSEDFSGERDILKERKLKQAEELLGKGIAIVDIARIMDEPETTVRELLKDCPDSCVSDDDDIDDYDLSIDADEVLSEEAREATENRERYLDEMDRYIGDPTQAPHYISREDFEDESHLDKISVDYYEGDKVFVEQEEIEPMEDPLTDFGTNDGDELFRNNPNREEPDIVYLRNFKMNSVFEITRYPQAYRSVKDGSAYVDGSSIHGG